MTGSIIIPSRNEKFLQNTITDLLSKGRNIEVIAVLDGYWPAPPLQDDKRLVILHKGKAEGMRPAINNGVSIASGEYVMKLDGHCMIDKGFDEKLNADCEDNWIVIPRRQPLEIETGKVTRWKT